MSDKIGKIVSLKDKLTNETIFPEGRTKAIYSEDGERLDVTLENMIISQGVLDGADNDLNNYTTNGQFYFSSANTPKNIPFGVNGFLTVNASNGIVKQTWRRTGTVNNNDHQEARRTLIGDTWSDWKKDISSGDLKKYSDHTRYYVDVDNGDDSYDGTQNKPFKTINRWLEMLNEGMNDLRCYITAKGSYEITKPVISNCALHITATVPNVTIINKVSTEAFCCYNVHWNFSSSNAQPLYLDSENDLMYCDNSAITLNNVSMLCPYRQYGGFFYAQNIIARNLKFYGVNASIDGLRLENADSWGSTPVTVDKGSNVAIFSSLTMDNGASSTQISATTEDPFINVINSRLVLDIGSDMDAISTCRYKYGIKASKSVVFTSTDLTNISVNGSIYSGCNTVDTTNNLWDMTKVSSQYLYTRSKITGKNIEVINTSNSSGNLAVGYGMKENKKNTAIYGDSIQMYANDSGIISGNKAYTNTSDKNLKKDITEVPEVFVKLWLELSPKMFRYNEKSGCESDEYQIGFIAQDVIALFEKYDLDYKDYGFAHKTKGIVENDDNEYFVLTYEYFDMLTLLVSQKQEKRINKLEDELINIKTMFNTILTKGGLKNE